MIKSTYHSRVSVNLGLILALPLDSFVTLTSQFGSMPLFCHLEMGAAVALSWGCCENVVCAHVCKHSIDVQCAAALCHVAVLQVLQSRNPAVCGNLNIIVEAHGDPPFLPPSSAPASSLAPC